ncbi:MAG TPA: glycosyl hydrolase family 28 protein, partial [Terracidiphilus sp.]
MLRRDFLSSLVVGVSAWAAGQSAPPAGMKNVMDFGAKPDGRSLNTHAIQRAIDQVFQTGGGMVYFPAGKFLSGRIDLKSRVGLYFGEGCTLLGSASISDYHGDSSAENPNQKHLIYAKDAEEVTLAGPGAIDGQGQNFWESSGKEPLPPDQAWDDIASHALKEKKTGRPSPMIRFAACRRVRVTGVQIANSAGWTLHVINSDDVEINRIAIRNPVNGPNTDGIDLTGCQNVAVSDCTIETGDDAICLKSENPEGGEPRLVKNIKVTNCRVTTCCNGLKIGTSSEGGFENIEFSNCEIISDNASIAERVVAGIALEVVDGGWIDGVKISGIHMRQARAPIFIRLGRRKQAHDYPQHGIRGVTIDNVQATGSLLASTITGLPDDRVGDVTLSNISVENVLRTRADQIPAEVPEKDHAYPEARMFGLLPASGLYVRHAGGLHMDRVSFTVHSEEERPTVMLDDIDGARISALSSTTVRGSRPIVSLTNTRNVTISGSTAPAGTGTFIAVNGSGSANVVLTGNDLHAAHRPVEVG